MRSDDSRFDGVAWVRHLVSESSSRNAVFDKESWSYEMPDSGGSQRRQRPYIGPGFRENSRLSSQTTYELDLPLPKRCHS